MKTIRVFLFTALLSAMMGICVPAVSQESPRTTTERNDDNDGGDYNWVGLLGLIGLAGLIRKNNNVPVTRTSTTPENAGYTR
jgi:hypothetical protein